MNRVVIVTDSSADLPQSLIHELNINILPLKIQIGANIYKDGVDFSSDEFYRKIKDGCDDIKTHQPSPAEFMEVYKELAKEYTEIISVHISSDLSGTVSSANIAKTMLGEDYDITVIDSKLSSLALGSLVVEIGRAAKEGKTKGEILNDTLKIKEQIQCYLLTHGECINKLVEIDEGDQETLFNIVRYNTDGFTLLEGHRNKSKALQDFVSNICSQLDKDLKYKIAIIHCDNLEDAIRLRDSIENSIVYDELIISETSSVVAYNIGLGAIGIVLYPA